MNNARCIYLSHESLLFLVGDDIFDFIFLRLDGIFFSLFTPCTDHSLKKPLHTPLAVDLFPVAARSISKKQ